MSTTRRIGLGRSLQANLTAHQPVSAGRERVWRAIAVANRAPEPVMRWKALAAPRFGDAKVGEYSGTFQLEELS